MLGGEQNWTCVFVACPGCEDAARRLGPTPVVYKVHDAVVLTDVEVPGVTGSVTAICGILYREKLGHAGAHRQVKLALIDRAGRLVPISVEREQNPIVIVDEAGVNLVLHGIGLGA